MLWHFSPSTSKREVSGTTKRRKGLTRRTHCASRSPSAGYGRQIDSSWESYSCIEAARTRSPQVIKRVYKVLPPSVADCNHYWFCGCHLGRAKVLLPSRTSPQLRQPRFLADRLTSISMLGKTKYQPMHTLPCTIPRHTYCAWRIATLSAKAGLHAMHTPPPTERIQCLTSPRASGYAPFPAPDS